MLMGFLVILLKRFIFCASSVGDIGSSVLGPGTRPTNDISIEFQIQ